MHFTPVSRWFKMVSTAIVVLPVLRSPMMSSRWPRPIGVIESIAFTPVWSGWATGWRPTIPGACTSRRRVASVETGPLPSMGSPSAFTTLPSSASPTGTERIRPVAFTTCSSSRLSTSPSTTAPIVSSSRFSARPRVPSSNSSSSFTAARGSPDTRAMPSPTSTIRPICSAPTSPVNSATCRRSAWVISSALMVSSAMSAPSGPLVATDVPVVAPVVLPRTARAARRPVRGALGPAEAEIRPAAGHDVLAQPVQPAARRRVQAQVPDLDVHPREQRRVDRDLQLDGRARQTGEPLREVPARLVVDLLAGADPGDPPPAGAGHLLHQPVQRPHQVAGPPTRDGVGGEAHGRGVRLGPEQVLDDGAPGGGREVAVGQRAAKLRRGVHDPGEPEELVLDGLELGDGQLLQHGLRVAPDPLARGAVAERLLRPVLALCDLAEPGGEPPERRRHVLGAHGPRRVGAQARRRRAHLARQQVGEHRTARARADGHVGHGRV